MRKLHVQLKVSQMTPLARRAFARWVTNNYVSHGSYMSHVTYSSVSNNPAAKPPTQGVGVSGFNAFGPMGVR